MDDLLDRWRAVLAEADDLEVRPPATEEAVAAFEARRGIELPADYRRFVLEVADGILADGEPALYGVVDLEADLAGDGDPAAPFPYGDADAAALLAAMAAVPAGRGVLADPAVMALQRPGQPDGCLTLTFGDGNAFSALVVTGEQRGRMWRTGEVDSPEVGALYGGGDLTPLGFLDWLAPWASDLLGLELDDA
ncbi:MAG TPA: SMI1/KNR4 family protein [Kofleriaceae bacterium]|nr:SMI1/KNR4 family protein [Kofleriaceae bacterium]